MSDNESLECDSAAGSGSGGEKASMLRKFLVNKFDLKSPGMDKVLAALDKKVP